MACKLNTASWPVHLLLMCRKIPGERGATVRYGPCRRSTAVSFAQPYTGERVFWPPKIGRPACFWAPHCRALSPSPPPTPTAAPALLSIDGRQTCSLLAASGSGAGLTIVSCTPVRAQITSPPSHEIVPGGGGLAASSGNFRGRLRAICVLDHPPL